MKPKTFPDISPEQLKFGIMPRKAKERMGQTLKVVGFDTETLPFRYSEIPDKSVTYNDIVSVQIAGERFADFHHLNFDPGLFRLDLLPPHAYVFAHNLPFDLGALLGKDYYKFIDGKTTIPSGNGFWRGFIIDGNMAFARLNYFEYVGKKKKRISRRELYFIDTGNYFKRKSLDQIAREQFPDNPELWKMGKPEYLGKRLPKDPDEWGYFEKYALQDSITTRELGLKIIHFAEMEGIRPMPTPAGFSASVFLRKYLKKPLYYGSLKQARFIWNCYHGGRFEPFGRGTFKNATVLDVNSLYPFSMCFPLPFYHNEDYEEFTLEDVRKDDSIIGWFSGRFRFPAETVYPCLPVATYKLFFPLSGFTKATIYELRLALEMGAELDHMKILGFRPNKTDIDHPLKEFVLDHYQKKAELDDIFRKKGELTGAQKDKRDLAKLLLNSLYGKFAERHPNPEGGPPQAGKLFYPPFASLITGKSREILGRYILKYESIYSDTDSIVTTRKIDKKDLGREIGKFKKEISGTITLVRSKQYRILDSKGHIKGAFHSFRSPKRFFEALDGAEWEYSEEKFIKPKEGRSRSLIPRSLITQKFRIKNNPDEKRRYLKHIPISKILTMNTLSVPLQKAPEKMLKK